MFAKPYKIKSNNTLKNSEKKHLVQRLQGAFPKATDENLKEIVSVKSTCICMKLVLYNDETVNVYAVDGAPMIIEREQELVPTVCALWKVPDLVPTLTIHTPVLTKVQGGAPLYLPGVAIPTAGVGFPQFHRGSIIAMCTGDNSAAGIIGRASMSSGDMLLRAAGVCMETLHVVGDQLCKDDKFSPLERPKRGPLACSQVTDITNEVSQLSLSAPREQWPALGGARAHNLPRLIPDPPPPTEEHHPAPSPEQSAAGVAENTAEVGAENEGGEEGQVPSDMEGLLRWSLLSFLKRGARHVELPLKTSLLYRNHLLPLCPEGRTLDVKKSSYKKMSKFLEAMQEEGLVEVREIEKGVSAVVGVQLLHPAVRAHAPPALAPAPALAAALAPAHAAYRPPLVREMFCVTAAVADLFAPIKKGTALTPAEVRTTLTEYVKRKELTSAQTKGAVTLDAVLAKIVGQPEQACMKWEPLMAGVQARMTASTEMRFADGGVALSKARLEPVTMHVATRSGNKKVTLVSNLEAFGFKLSELSHVCQVGVAASCGVTRSPGAKADQLMLQGDQTHFMAKLLIEKYGLPKKFVEGADKALKKKK